MDDETKFGLLADINQFFTPGAPIDSRYLFAGRRKQVDRLIATIFQKGSHAVIFGERGVGKTSLANTLFDFLVLLGKFQYQRAKLNSAEGMTFEQIWLSIFKQFTFNDSEGTTTLDRHLPEHPHSESVRETFQLMDDPAIVIIDELDGITDGGIKKMLADTIKALSDNGIRATLILLGVADSVDQLIGAHPSIERAVIQVPLERMSRGELLEIIDKGVSHCPGLSIESTVRERIADYSQGLPFYTHMLAREASTYAIQHDSPNVTMSYLEGGIREVVNVHQETLLSVYNAAVTAPRGKYFKPVLLACALAEKDERGYFYAKNVAIPLKAMGFDLEIPAFAQHLKDFSETRGPILQRDKRRYRFLKPNMGPYVILRGLADGLIRESQLSHPGGDSTEPAQLSLLSGASGPPIEL